jgi:hypothetical protein
MLMGGRRVAEIVHETGTPGQCLASAIGNPCEIAGAASALASKQSAISLLWQQFSSQSVSMIALCEWQIAPICAETVPKN